jgi:hypothetical protein
MNHGNLIGMKAVMRNYVHTHTRLLRKLWQPCYSIRPCVVANVTVTFAVTFVVMWTPGVWCILLYNLFMKHTYCQDFKLSSHNSFLNTVNWTKHLQHNDIIWTRTWQFFVWMFINNGPHNKGKPYLQKNIMQSFFTFHNTFNEQKTNYVTINR